MVADFTSAKEHTKYELFCGCRTGDPPFPPPVLSIIFPKTFQKSFSEQAQKIPPSAL